MSIARRASQLRAIESTWSTRGRIWDWSLANGDTGDAANTIEHVWLGVAADQGHGALISAGTFVDGDMLTGITLMKYTTNGY